MNKKKAEEVILNKTKLLTKAELRMMVKECLMEYLRERLSSFIADSRVNELVSARLMDYFRSASFRSTVEMMLEREMPRVRKVVDDLAIGFLEKKRTEFVKSVGSKKSRPAPRKIKF